MWTVYSVYTLLLAIFLFMAGTGALPSVIGIRLNDAGVSDLIIGLLGTAYFGGLTLGSIMAFGLIGRVGHIRAFAVYVSIASATALAYSLAQNVPVWLALRVINGFCVAGVFVCLESWLNDQADPDRRGSTLAFYMIALYAGQALSQLALGVEPGNPRLPFVIAALVLSMTVVPVALTRMAEPSLDAQSVMPIRALYAASPLGLVGVVSTGLALGAFYIMAPIHAQQIGLSNLETASLIGIVIVGGLVLQWPLGWLSDRIDRRKVIVATFAAATLVCAGMANVLDKTLVTGLGAVFGGLAFALYPLCVAHTNDHLSVGERVGASGGLILAYSAGAAAGPLMASACMRVLGPGGLYWFIAATSGLVLLFGLYRQIAAPPVPADDQNAFQALARTTPALAPLDPEIPAEGTDAATG